jgi:hypothetical protein
MTAHQIQQNKNFLDTFGYLQLELPSNFNYDDYKNEVIKASTLLMNSEWKDIVAQKRSFIVPAFADNSSIGSEFLVNYLDNQIKPLLGKNYIYLGSDASIFFAAGSAWHRDLAMHLPVLKLNIYLDFDADNQSCEFLIIPGSHHVASSYSSLLQNALAWPDKPGYCGGLSESGFLPSGLDPTAPGYNANRDLIPAKAIAVKPRAAVIFNTAAIHAVKSHVQMGKPRRLITYIFCTNPKDIKDTHFSRSHNGVNLNDDALINEIYLWKATEAVRFGIKSYGEGLSKYSEYIRDHGLDWELVSKIASGLKQEFDREDGSHEQSQMKKMTAYLTQNLTYLDGSFV